MNPQANNTTTSSGRDFKIVNTVRRRRLFLLVVRGLAICLAVAAVLLLVTGLAAHSYRHHDNILILLRVGALLGIIASIFFFLIQPLRKRITDAQVARLVEERHPALGDRLVTAVELRDDEVIPIPEHAN